MTNVCFFYVKQKPWLISSISSTLVISLFISQQNSIEIFAKNTQRKRVALWSTFLRLFETRICWLRFTFKSKLLLLARLIFNSVRFVSFHYVLFVSLFFLLFSLYYRLIQDFFFHFTCNFAISYVFSIFGKYSVILWHLWQRLLTIVVFIYRFIEKILGKFRKITSVDGR